MSKNGRILVAMSGGVDSSLVAIMLHNTGYEVVGITMKTWDYNNTCGKKKIGCCDINSINDARLLASKYGFIHYVVNIESEFKEYIISNFISEYLGGKTPNPCVLCNTNIKWGLLLNKANNLDCEYIATGHYANIRKENNRYILSKGLDSYKDQSYFLWGMTQDNLKRTKFPLGQYEKHIIKNMVRNMGHYNIANKKESYELCFIPNGNYKDFLKKKCTKQIKSGNFIDINGKIIGKHEGYPFYTIGQRKHLGLHLQSVMYVIKILPDTNEIILGSKNDLKQRECNIIKFNIIKYHNIVNPIKAITKIRYGDIGSESTINLVSNDIINIKFNNDIYALTPGQSAVMYENDDVIGGGFITN